MKMENKAKRNLMIFWMVILFVPFIQWSLHLFKGGELKGGVVIAPDVEFSLAGWINGDYQREKEKYFNDQFGFRNDFVRLHNQIGYSLFKKMNANGVVVGKDSYLFEKPYIECLFGENYVGDSIIIDRVRKLKMLRDTFNRMGKHLVVVLAPNKARFFPQMIPNDLRTKQTTTNYDQYVKYFAENQVPILDCNAYFLHISDTSRYDLFPKYGTHWSMYGGSLIRDSLVNIIEDVSGKPLPKFAKTIRLSDYPEYTDADIGDGLNLIQKLQGGPYAYASYQQIDSSKKSSVKIISISDSFYWTMVYLDFPNMFQNNQFWYYFSEIWPERKRPDGQKMTIPDINLQDEINNNDLFIIMVSEVNLGYIGFSFTDQAYQLYFGK
jgi:hypothetical protein